MVEELTLYGVEVLHPDLLDMDERTLPLAEEEVLERRKRQEILIGIHNSLSDDTEGESPVGGLNGLSPYPPGANPPNAALFQ
ncbi:MAG: hypothetical protein NT005_03415 [Spirochaetes bacterium]|nr:hypothetical protein [Spirochaetota bacterium]